jgi:hypothetical protein
VAGIPVLESAIWAGVPGEPAGWTPWARAAWEPAKVSSRTLAATAAHTATAVVATAAPGLARMLPQLSCLIAREKRAAHLASARRITRRRYATASSAAEEQRLKTFSRSSGGSAASGSKPERTVGRSAP